MTKNKQTKDKQPKKKKITSGHWCSLTLLMMNQGKKFVNFSNILDIEEYVIDIEGKFRFDTHEIFLDSC